MGLSTGLNTVKISVIDQETQREKAVFQYSDMDYQHLLLLELAIAKGIIAFGESIASKYPPL